MPELTCFRLLDAESPAGPLADAVRQVNAGQSGLAVFTVDPVSFKQVPNAPFAYWVEEKIRRIFTKLPAFESDGRAARQGLATADDFRYVRCWWEVRTQTEGSPGRTWWPFAKGGAYSPYYADLHLVVNWFGGGMEMASFEGSVVRNPDFYFRPGLTWSGFTTKEFGSRVLPRGSIFSHIGLSAFDVNERAILKNIALLNSSHLRSLMALSLGLADSGRRVYSVGTVQLLPMPVLGETAAEVLANKAVAIWTRKYLVDMASEISHAFIVPWHGPKIQALKELEIMDQAARQLLENFTIEQEVEINKITESLYGFKLPPTATKAHVSAPVDAEDDAASNHDVARSLVSYLVGVTFGRWAIPTNTEELRKPPTDPFAPLPAEAPGAAPAEAAKLYYAEDAGGESPLLSGGREALRQATGLRSVDGYEQELASRLGVATLNDYLSHPAGFFADHLAVYSKSRRQAPIYWPLSTKSGNFTLWVYYPKLDDQSLPKLIADVLSPKIRTLTQEIENRRATPGGKVAELEALRQELEEMRTDFRDLINRGYRPNQNDGVLITACPLAKYFRHAGFRKNLEACWKELARGDYDWSHLAMAMWPDRALEACKTDRSIAIAHAREDLCPAEPPKAARGRKKTLPSP